MIVYQTFPKLSDAILKDSGFIKRIGLPTEAKSKNQAREVYSLWKPIK